MGPSGEELEPRPLPRYKGEEGVCRLLLQQAGPLCSSTRGGWQHRCQVSAKRVSSIVEYLLVSFEAIKGTVRPEECYHSKGLD